MLSTTTTRVLFSVLAFGCCASAQTFFPVPTLQFVKPFGGADPLPQVITVASATNTQFTYTVTSFTSTGSWLVPSPGTGCCEGTPSSISVGVLTSATLAVGSYSGQIVLTAYDTAITLTVMANLTVTATATSFLDNLPGQMSFWMQPGGTALSSQFIQVRNGGTGSLSWNLAMSTADGGGWLTSNVSSGTAPTTVTVGVNVANLPNHGSIAGTYVGQLVFSGGSTTETVPIVVAVGNNLFDQVNPLNFTMVFGGANPLPQVVTLASSGTTSVSSTVTGSSTATGGSWLPSLTTGCCLGTPSAITVKVAAPAAMPVGTYTGQFVVTPYDDEGVAMVVPVTLTVAPVGSDYLDNLTGQMSFSMVKNGASVTSQFIQVRDAGPGSLDWSLTTSTADTSPWLTASSYSGTAPTILTVGVTPANLPNGGVIPGTFIGQLVFTGNGTTVTVPVSVTVGADVFTQVNGINFTKVFGGANPLSQKLTIPSTGSASLSYTVYTYTASGGSWLSSPGNSGCCLGTPSSLTVTVDAAADLAVGTYTGEVAIVPYDDEGAPMIVPVTLTVAAVGTTYFDDMPGQMSFSLATGAANNPPAQPIQIRNGGQGTLNWTLVTSTADGGSWLNASTTSGTAPSTVSVSISKSQLPNAGNVAGTFIGQLVFQTPGSVVTVPVSVSVGANVFTQVNPISFVMTAGGANPLPQILTIPSTGTSSISYTIAASTANGGNWLSSPITSGCCYGTPSTIVAAVSAPANLSAGTYTGQIVLTPYDDEGVPMTVPVTLTVAPPSGTYFDNVQGQVSFFIPTNSGNPVSQSVQLRNAGSGTLNWTLAAITADGANWLTASAYSGTAPAAVSIGVTTSALPNGGAVAGVFAGELIFTTTGETVTIPVVAQVGTNIFVEPAPLNFSKTFEGSNPSSQMEPVAGTGTAISFTVDTSAGNGGAWLSTNYGLGCCAVTPTNVTTSITASAGLAPGTYTGQMVAIPYENGGVSMTMPVYLTVTNPFTLNAYSANATAGGGTGSVNVHSTLQTAPWTGASNASFLTISSGASGQGNGTVNYSVAPNLSATGRTGTLTIAGDTFTVTQDGFAVPCNAQQDGTVNAAAVQLMINEALGVAAAANDLNSDGVVTIVDVEIVINVALGLGCSG